MSGPHGRRGCSARRRVSCFEFAAIILIAVFPLVTYAANPPASPAPGTSIQNFSLKDIHRRPRLLDAYKDKKALVVVFVGAECPLANLYYPTLVDLHREYSDQGVQILAINSNNQDTFPIVSAHAQERDLPFPVLKDFDQKVAAAFGAAGPGSVPARRQARDPLSRPHRRSVRHRVSPRKPTQSELKNALDELLAGKPITTPETETSGCLISRVEPPVADKQVTYAKQVSRIIQKRCQECHRPNEVAPSRF